MDMSVPNTLSLVQDSNLAFNAVALRFDSWSQRYQTFDEQTRCRTLAEHSRACARDVVAIHNRYLHFCGDIFQPGDDIGHKALKQQSEAIKFLEKHMHALAEPSKWGPMASSTFDWWYEALADLRKRIFMAMHEQSQRLKRAVALPTKTPPVTTVAKLQAQHGSDEEEESDDSDESDDEADKSNQPQINTIVKIRASSRQPAVKYVTHFHKTVVKVSEQSDAKYLMECSQKSDRKLVASAKAKKNRRSRRKTR